MSEALNNATKDLAIDPELNQIREELNLAVGMCALTGAVTELSDADDRRSRRRQRVDNRLDNRHYDFTNPIITGPSCDDLYPFLKDDQWEYVSASPLANIDLREMIASTVLAILPYAANYTTIIGEDRGGRIPALVIGKAIDAMRERQGLTGARKLFIAGRIGREACPVFQAKAPDDTALLVTEYINGGETIKGVLRALGRVGFERVDVATIDRTSEIVAYGISPERFFMGDSNSYIGRSDSHLHGINFMYTGVTKVPGEAHARRTLLSKNERKVLAGTRRDIRHLADEIVGLWDSRSSVQEAHS